MNLIDWEMSINSCKKILIQDFQNPNSGEKSLRMGPSCKIKTNPNYKNIFTSNLKTFGMPKYENYEIQNPIRRRRV